MKSKVTISKKDMIVIVACLLFLLATVGSVGSGGRRRAKEAVCASNLRRLGTAFEQFTSENDGYFHKGYMGIPDCATTNWWFEALKPYYANQDLCLCPMAARPGADVGLGEVGAKFYAWSAQGWLPEGYYGSYGINGWVENNQCEHEPEAMKRRRWRKPNVAGGSNIPLLLDAQWLDGWPHHYDNPPAFDDEDFRHGSQMIRFCINRHDGFINGVFLDGSARKIGLKELWKLKWHRKFDTDSPSPHWPVWMRDFEDY